MSLRCFIGHPAVGFATKRLAPKASLEALIAAPLLLDLLWTVFLLHGLEQVRIDPGNTASATRQGAPKPMGPDAP